MPTIFVLNGPNLNLLGRRQPDVYGSETLKDVEAICHAACMPGFDIRQAQSNHEGEIVELIHEAREAACGIVINPAAYSHSSIAILDALNAFDGPVMEVHISQVHRREPYRHHSYVSHRADGVIAGLGLEGYAAAVRRVCQITNIT